MTEIRIYDRGLRWTQYTWPFLYRYEAVEWAVPRMTMARGLTVASAERRARRAYNRRALDARRLLNPVHVIRLGDPKPADDQTAALL